MANRPLLLFPTPELASKSKLGGGRGGFHKPTHMSQVNRVAPRLQLLQTILGNKAIALQSAPTGIEPELTLVIETVGSVDGFLSAVKKIDGLEWLGEYEQDEIEPDQEFYNPKDKNKQLSGRLFFLFTNQNAMHQLLNLWNTFSANPDKKFSEIFDYGLASIGRLFAQIKTIRYWDIQDRIEETGILDAWQENLKRDGDQMIRFETELWFRASSEKRQSGAQRVNSLIKELGGKIVSQCVLPEIAYHSILSELPRNAIQNLISHLDTELTQCDSVMFFRPVGQIATGKETIKSDLTDFESKDWPLPAGDPVVAILDGLPLANHNLLADRLIVDDPDDYASQYPVVDRVHGTEMSSLIVHGDLSCDEQPLARPVYVRPIMKPIQWINSPRPEQIPEDVLFVDLVHQAIRRMFDDEDPGGAASPNIKVINLSIGDPSRQFIQLMSPLARLLDWLSVKYSVLFVISAGNHSHDIETNMSKIDFRNLSVSDREKMIVRKLYENTRHRRLLSPAESINGITVGAVHADYATVVHYGHSLDLYNNVLPSPVSSFGSGYRRSVKPDLIFSGGRVLYEEPVGTTGDAVLKVRDVRAAPGNQVASPSNIAGDLDKTAYSCGTSNSSALISRAAGICYDSLVEIFNNQAPDFEYERFIVPLLKAMVVHGCSWDEIGSRLQTILHTSENGRQLKNWIVQWLGYGAPDVTKVLDCTEQRVSILGFGQLEDTQAHVFILPLPTSLGARREWRRLTVTLAWLSPIAARTQRYRIASLWFEVDDGVLTPERKDAEWQTVRRGTVQHEVFEGVRAVPISNGDTLSIKVNCRKDAAKIDEPVSYGLVVSLEISEGIDIAIYEEVRAQIAVPVQIRQVSSGSTI